MSDAILIVKILETLVRKDEFGRYINEYQKWAYGGFETFEGFEGDSSSFEDKIDAVMAKMHKAYLIDLVYDKYTKKPSHISLRPEGLSLYRTLDLN